MGSLIGLLALLVQAYAGEMTASQSTEVQDLDDTTVGMPSFWEEREWAESAPARLAMAKKLKAMKAAPKAMKEAMKAAPKAKAAMKVASKPAPMKASKKAELLQGEGSFTLLAVYGLVAVG